MPQSADAVEAIRKSAAERKQVTLLFVDIVASSTMVSGRDPEEADQDLQIILSALTGSVQRYRGLVAQVLGDGIMAMFGAPAAQEDHALRACLAAQDMLRTATGSATGPAAGGPGGHRLPPFSLRIGVASGEVVTQLVENAARHDQRAVGECVHLAAKLQQNAGPNTALLSETTLAQAGPALDVAPVGNFSLAMGAPPAPVYRLVEARAVRRTAMDLLSSAPGLFVGRTVELAALAHALRETAAGSGRAVLITGDAGIGKSRLAGEFLSRNDAGSGVGSGAVVHWPQSAIRRLGEPDDLESAARSLVPLAGGRDGSGAGALADAAGRGAGSLARAAVLDLLGLPADDPLWPGLDPAQRLTFAVEGIVGALMELSRPHPVIVLVEDAHWAGAVMARLLDCLAALAAGARVLLLATTRGEDAGWRAPTGAQRIPLAPLTEQQIDAFLDHWLGGDASVAPLKARVAGKSQGVPLYLEESLRALEAAGAIEGAPGRYRVIDADRVVALPPTIHGLIASRIDTLDDDARRTLLNAAVIGATFDVALLRQLGPVAEAVFDGVLLRLESAGFVESGRVLPARELRFRHALMQEVAYTTITKRDRRSLHTRVLRALRKRRTAELPGRVELMAHHAFQAEEWALAYAYGRAAGRRAENRSKLVDAGQHYEKASSALALIDPTPRNRRRRIDLDIALPRVYLARGNIDTEGTLQSAQRQSEALGDRVRLARANSMLASLKWSLGDLDEGIVLCQKSLSETAVAGDPETLMQLLTRLGGILAAKGHFASALAPLDTAIRLSGERSIIGLAGMLVPPGVGSRCFRALSLAEMGHEREAFAACSGALAEAEEFGHAFSQILANAYQGWVALVCESPRSGIPFLENALKLCEVTRCILWKDFVRGALGYSRLCMGDGKRGIELLKDAVDNVSTKILNVHRPQMLIWLADGYRQIGDIREARRVAAQALEDSRATGQLAYEARALFVAAGAMSLEPGGAGDALATAQEAERRASRLNMKPLQRRCSTFVAEQRHHALHAGIAVG